MWRRSSRSRQLLRSAFALGGVSAAGVWLSAAACSFLYDSDKLPSQPDGGIDAPLDSCGLELEAVASPDLQEGWGDGGGRPALLVVRGKNLAKDATIKLSPSTPSDAPQVELLGQPEISSGGGFLAVQLVAHVDPALAAGAAIPLTITISQTCNGAPVEQTLADALRVIGLGELTAAPADGLLTGAPHLYSKIQVTGALSVKAGETGPLILRSNSSLELGGAISVNGGTITPGPGAAAGGPKGSSGAGPGRGEGAPATGGNGGGAGYVADASGSLAGKLAGDPLITSFAKNQGSGGGGGVGVLGLVGGDAGGGGGTVELTARGVAKLTNLSAVGGAGTQGNGSAGGGGSGGTIVLRGSEVTAGTLDVSGGASAGNRGAAGRVRIDTPSLIAATTVPAGGARRGGTFRADVPWFITEAQLSISLLGTAAAQIDVRVLDRDRQPLGLPVALDFQGADEATAKIPLKQGYNLICAVPQGSSVSVAESTNCVEVARLAQ